RNRLEHCLADLGAVHLGAIPVSMYTTLAPEQISWTAAHCSAKVAVVDDLEFLERWEKVRADLPDLERVVVATGGPNAAASERAMDWADVESLGEQALAAAAGREAFEAGRRDVAPEP